MLSSYTALLGGIVYAQTSGHGFNLAKIAEGFGSSISALLSTENLNATVYSLLAAGLGLYSGVLLFGPHEVSTIAPTLSCNPCQLLHCQWHCTCQSQRSVQERLCECRDAAAAGLSVADFQLAAWLLQCQ